VVGNISIIEMLYETPFPGTPQTNLVPKKSERNTEIIALYETGTSGANIAKEFGISEQRVNQIVHGRRK
jgi:DNA-binding NarL/FixJ family response regulator